MFDEYVTRKMYTIMEVLASNSGYMSMKAIRNAISAEYPSKEPRALYVTLRKMEKRGYIKRISGSGREKDVELNEKGKLYIQNFKKPG